MAGRSGTLLPTMGHERLDSVVRPKGIDFDERASGVDVPLRLCRSVPQLPGGHGLAGGVASGSAMEQVPAPQTKEPPLRLLLPERLRSRRRDHEER
uniref:Hp3 n=1 Tax=Insect-associated tombusvirus 1 TaxID=2692406 RepID=A0A6B9KYR6_9TOMB|nr:hp3 [Insect-associated tombusvirus 1]